MKRYVVKRYSNGKWILLTVKLYAEDILDAWNKAKAIYSNPITQVIEYSRWLDMAD